MMTTDAFEQADGEDADKGRVKIRPYGTPMLIILKGERNLLAAEIDSQADFTIIAI